MSPFPAAADTFQAQTARKSDRDASVLLRRDTMSEARSVCVMPKVAVLGAYRDVSGVPANRAETRVGLERCQVVEER